MTAHTDLAAGLRHDRSGRRRAGRTLAVLALVVLVAAGLVLLLARATTVCRRARRRGRVST